MLANIYLHYILDLWFKLAVKRQARGFTQLIRYCDDYVVCFQAEREAREFAQRLRERLGRVGLKIAEEKSRIIEFGRYPYFKALEKAKGQPPLTFWDSLTTALRPERARLD